MTTDFLTLVHRDHDDLERALDQLLQAESAVDIRTTLDGVRLGLTAHAEAEDIVLYQALTRSNSDRVIEALVQDAHEQHVAQEKALASLVSSRPHSPEWRDSIQRLRDLVHDHAEQEESRILPAFRELMPKVYEALAGEFATERLRQLAMLQPSGPISIPERAAS
ncbi:MAG: hemerythrin domain-containing protein [Deltaproteobacteria bacterium]|nr:hemerythrin domain-containing protein [Deltaproteobacteria bacterium]